MTSWKKVLESPNKSWVMTDPNVNPWQMANKNQNKNCIIEAILPAFLAFKISTIHRRYDINLVPEAANMAEWT